MNEAIANQPLFFVNPVPLDLEKHGQAGLKKQTSLAFAKNSNSVPIGLVEILECARSMPIVFTQDEQPAAVAVMGFEQNNYFITKDHQWRKGHHMPLYIRKYPFAFFESKEDEKFILCVDEKAEHFMAQTPDLPFYHNAQASPTSQQALELCGLFHQQYMAAGQFAKALKDKGLLVAKEVEASLADGRQTKMAGFMMIDEDKWNALDDTTYLQWRKNGFSVLVSAVLLSYRNWKYLPAMEE